MIHGMTGFGRGEATAPSVRVVAEVRTVNHRHLDVDVRGDALPAELAAGLRRVVAARLSRGKVDISVRLEFEGGGASLRINRHVLREYLTGLAELGRELGLEGQPTLDHVAALPWGRGFDLVERELAPDQAQAVESALGHALDGVLTARTAEGVAVVADLEAHLATVRARLAEVVASAPALALAQAARLRQRIAELLGEVACDPARLAQEVALLADRTDVAEELSRLASHLDSLSGMLAGGGAGPHGKRLDFTLQEAFREVNTLGSKARDAALAALVVDMKTALERMREQAANVE